MFFLVIRNSHQRCSVKKGVVKNFAKFTGKHLCQRLFFNTCANTCTTCNICATSGRLLLDHDILNVAISLLLKIVEAISFHNNYASWLRSSRSSHRRCSSILVFLKISQYSQETPLCWRLFLLKLQAWVLRNFYEQLFYRIAPVAASVAIVKVIQKYSLKCWSYKISVRDKHNEMSTCDFRFCLPLFRQSTSLFRSP